MLNLSKIINRLIFLGIPTILAIIAICFAFFDIVDRGHVTSFSKYFYLIFACLTIINALILVIYDSKNEKI